MLVRMRLAVVGRLVTVADDVVLMVAGIIPILMVAVVMVMVVVMITSCTAVVAGAVCNETSDGNMPGAGAARWSDERHVT